MNDTSDGYHVPVLPDEVLEFLAVEPGDTVLDATVGGGGHSALIAERIVPGGRLICLDRDPEAIVAAQERLAPFRERANISILHTPFGALCDAIDQLPGGSDIRFDGILFDLGVSSHQLDTNRGFSFRREEDLNMRMDAAQESTAADLLMSLTEPELAKVLWELGEERFSRRIAHALVERRRQGRPVRTTHELAAVVEQAVPKSAWPRDIHVASRTFMALRIAVNDELGQLRAGLAAAVGRLAPQGRLVVISFHSLEDRIAKQAILNWAGRGPSPSGSSPAAFLFENNFRPLLKILTRKPVMATEREVANNPRARSAKLRAAERIP
jgi:16S rRNA (cytosine1402-N4)-methyltransferase